MSVLIGQPQVSLWKTAAGQNCRPPKDHLDDHNSLKPICIKVLKCIMCFDRRKEVRWFVVVVLNVPYQESIYFIIL